MRSVPGCAATLTVAFLLSPPAVLADDRTENSISNKANAVTLLLQFEGNHSHVSLEEMKRELDTLMRESKVKFDYRLLKDLGGNDSFADLIVVKFKGSCRWEPVPILYDERGPLAFTHVSDGAVLPFSEVACDRIRVSIRSAMYGGDYARGDALMGRALARVVAHELFHIMARTQKHGHKGVARTSLSASQLIAEKLDMEPEDLHRMITRE